MRIAPIASGSSGNCIYVGDDKTHILIDAGISAKNIEEGLHSLDLSLDDIDAILITHEHSDHIKGLGVLERKREIPIYASQGTIEGILSTKSLGSFNRDCFKSLRDLSPFTINDFTFNPHPVSHDANEPVCFSFENAHKRAAVVTDLGCYDDELLKSLGKLDFIFAEANHDIRMLQLGPYSYPLKRRILSDRGHLSNEASGRFISRLLNDDIKSIMIGHLSDKNNLPDLAYEAVKVEITMSDTKYDGLDFPIYVAKRNEMSKIVYC
ncbi:MAG: MBL fold metallo-hydrolase [Lachnospiraceae bacterium]|nr:MBL fold metallo-hydrolase [Lachnospiraceae bacterium]